MWGLNGPSCENPSCKHEAASSFSTLHRTEPKIGSRSLRCLELTPKPSTERASNFPNITQLVWCRAGTWIQVILFPIGCFYFFPLPPFPYLESSSQLYSSYTLPRQSYPGPCCQPSLPGGNSKSTLLVPGPPIRASPSSADFWSMVPWMGPWMVLSYSSSWPHFLLQLPPTTCPSPDTVHFRSWKLSLPSHHVGVETEHGFWNQTDLGWTWPAFGCRILWRAGDIALALASRSNNQSYNFADLSCPGDCQLQSPPCCFPEEGGSSTTREQPRQLQPHSLSAEIHSAQQGPSPSLILSPSSLSIRSVVLCNSHWFHSF